MDILGQDSSSYQPLAVVALRTPYGLDSQATLCNKSVMMLHQGAGRSARLSGKPDWAYCRHSETCECRTLSQNSKCLDSANAVWRLYPASFAHRPDLTKLPRSVSKIIGPGPLTPSSQVPSCHGLHTFCHRHWRHH